MKLFSAKEKATIQHHAHVFVSREKESTIIATLHFNGKGGILYEDNAPVVLSAPLEPVLIGQTLLAALQCTTNKALLGRRKLTDWPAFRASKATSVHQFEQNFIRIHVSGANDENLVYLLDGEPYKGAELHVTSSVSNSVSTAKIGECLMSVFHACRDRRI